MVQTEGGLLIGTGLCHAIFMFVMHNNYILPYLFVHKTTSD